MWIVHSRILWRCVLAVYMALDLNLNNVCQVILVVNSPHQETPLHWAAYEGHVETVRCLVDKGADTNIKNIFEVSEWEFTADCKLIRVCFQSSTKHLVSTIVKCIAISWWLAHLPKIILSLYRSQAGQNYLYSASVTMTHYLLMLAWQTMTIFTDSSVLVIGFILVIGFMRAEAMETEEKVNVTINITHGLAVEAFT